MMFELFTAKTPSSQRLVDFRSRRSQRLRGKFSV